MAESIYNVKAWDTNVAYQKNDIVLTRTDLPPAGSGVPKTIRYFYALKASTGQSPIDASGIPVYNSAYWGGYSKINGAPKPNFLWTPSYNANTTHRPKVLTVNFGEGYEQRIPDGLFNSPITANLTFEMRGEKETRAIVHFLKTRKGSQSFTVKHLPEIYTDGTGDEYKKLFICGDFSSNFVFHNNYGISASFIQKNN